MIFILLSCFQSYHILPQNMVYIESDSLNQIPQDVDPENGWINMDGVHP